MLGFGGMHVDRPHDVVSAWDRALPISRPVVIEAMVVPNVPPLPPHATAEPVKHYLRALVHRDPDALGIVIQSAEEWRSGI